VLHCEQCRGILQGKVAAWRLSVSKCWELGVWHSQHKVQGVL
jgi:hypothetical protein